MPNRRGNMFSAHGDMPLSNWELKDSEATFGDAEPAWCVGCPSSPPPPPPRHHACLCLCHSVWARCIAPPRVISRVTALLFA
jgi:hypothetical protein